MVATTELENNNNVGQPDMKYELLQDQVVDEVHLGNKCGQVFLDKGSFYFICEYCYQVFVDAQYYMHHILTYHYTEDLQNLDNIPDISGIKQEEEFNE